MPSISQHCTRPTITCLSNSSWLKTQQMLSRLCSSLCTTMRRETGPNTANTSTAATKAPNRGLGARRHRGCATRMEPPLLQRATFQWNWTKKWPEQNCKATQANSVHKLPDCIERPTRSLGFWTSQTVQLTQFASHLKNSLVAAIRRPNSLQTTVPAYFPQYLPKFMACPKRSAVHPTCDTHGEGENAESPTEHRVKCQGAEAAGKPAAEHDDRSGVLRETGRAMHDDSHWPPLAAVQ